jgi:hypothetical protein
MSGFAHEAEPSREPLSGPIDIDPFTLAREAGPLLPKMTEAEEARSQGIHRYVVTVTNLETGDVAWTPAQGYSPYGAAADAATTPEELWKP